MELTEKVFGKELKSIVVNEDKKVVTAVVEDATMLAVANAPLVDLFLDTERMKADAKKVAMVKCSENDEFDKYVGAALTLVYAMFGSRTQFRKFVDEFATVIEKKEKPVSAKKNSKKAGK